MKKSTVTKIWIAGLVSFVAGLIVGFIGLGVMLGLGGTWEPSTAHSGSDFVASYNTAFWTGMYVMIGGFTFAGLSIIVQLAAWVGALVNTYQVPDKTWFAVVLVTGLFGFGFALIGFAGMIAYLIAGPDGSLYSASTPPMPAARPSTLAPTS